MDAKLPRGFAQHDALFVKRLVVCLAALLWIGAGADAAPGSSPSQTTSSMPAAHGSPPTSRPRDEVWLVSCRGVDALGGAPNLHQLALERHHSDQRWTTSNQQAFLSPGNRGSTTIVFVPGDGYSHRQSRELGMQAYRRTVAGLPPEPAVRFVIWSWPSDHATRRRVRDVRIKANRTPWVAWCLSHWLDTIEGAGPICLVGTGLGARVVGETLHLRGSGALGPYRLASKPRSPVRAVLISAAIDNDSLLPGRRLDRALSGVERLLVVTNSTDPVLRRYRWLYGFRSRAVALGYAGLAGGGRWPADAAKIAQVDVASSVGPNHGFMYFFSAPQVVARIQPYAIEPARPLLARDPRATAR